MRRWLGVLGLALVAALPGQAQESPKLEFFQGFSYLSQDLTELVGSHKNFFGFGSAFNFNLNEKFGIEGDFSGQYATIFGVFTLQNYQYMGGPRLTFRREKATWFLHALFGGATLSSGLGSGLAMAFGAGYDLNLGEGAAIRIVQADYFSTRFFGGQQDNARFSFGFVLKIGGE